MGVTADDISRVTGEAKPERPEPRNRIEAAHQAASEIDDRMDDLVERERQAGESKATAYDRVLRDNPELYSGLKRAKAKAITKAGIGDAAVGGV